MIDILVIAFIIVAVCFTSYRGVLWVVDTWDMGRQALRDRSE